MFEFFYTLHVCSLKSYLKDQLLNIVKMARKLCNHGRQPSRCREFSGSSFCIHDKLKSRCVDCVGSEICQNKI